MIILLLLFYLFVGNGAAAAGTNGARTKGIGGHITQRFGFFFKAYLFFICHCIFKMPFIIF